MFAKTLRELRKSRRLTQRQLADMLFIDCSTVTKWETRKAYPDFEKQQKLAEIFDVSLDYLVGRSDTPTSPAPAPEKEISDIDIMIATESKDLSDKDKQEILHLIQYKKRQTEATTAPFQSSRARTTINFEDDTERIAAFGGMEETDDEPLMT